MELHQFRYFLALARTLNFTRAAELSNVTQPALTKAIKKLEEELGGALVHRERRRTQLTDLGTLLLPILEQATAAADSAGRRAKEYQNREVAPLRVGFAPTISPSLIVGLLAELVRSVPGLEVNIVQRRPDEMTDALMNGDIHVAICGDYEAAGERIREWTVFSEPYVVVCSRQHPFTNQKSVSRSDLKSAAWLELSECEKWYDFRELCFDDGEAPNVVHRAAQGSYLQALAAAGLGVMLAPRHVPILPDLVALPIDGDPIQRNVRLLVMTGRRYSPALDAFIKIARQRDWTTDTVAQRARRPAPRAVFV